MNKALLACLLLAFSLTVAAQEQADTTDVFYKHLRLNELVVTGVTGQTRLRDMAAPASLITPRELRATAATNIVDAISHQPGMAEITTGNGISKPVIRGLGYNRVLVVSDGVRQEGQQWGDEHGLEIDAQGVGSVEILKGPASLIYGSDAMAGVLILHSEPIPAEGDITGKVSAGYQTNSGLFDYSLGLAGNQRGIVWRARYSEKMAHELKTPTDGYIPGTQMHERAAHGLLGLNKNWGHSHLKADFYHLTPSIAEGERDPLTGELEHSYRLKTYHRQLPFQQVRHYKATWDNQLNLPAGYLKAIIAYQQNRRQEYEDDTDEAELDFRLHTTTYDLRYQLPAEGWQLATGIAGMYQHSQNLAEETLIPNYRLADIGGYATAQKTLSQWIISGGLRIDNRHINHYGNYTGLTGSIGAVRELCRHTNLRLNIARGFRAPNISELASDGIHEGTLRYEIGNPDLKPEYSWQADLGADYQGKYFSFQISMFINRIENYIFAKKDIRGVQDNYKLSTINYQTYVYTQGDAVLKGFEVSADFHPIHSLHFGNSFSIVDARQLHQTRQTRYLPMTPAPRWTSDIKYEITHHGRTLNNTYVSAGLDCYLAQTHYYMADDTETRTPSYTLFNLTAGTDIIWGRKKVAEVYLSAQNIFNRAYQNHLSRLKYTDINNVTGHQGIDNPGRNIAVKVILPITL